jgi:hypothetical protein
MKKFEIEGCIKKIFIYFKKKKMILTEENDKFLNEFKKKVNIEETSSLNESELFRNFVEKKGTLFQEPKNFFPFIKKDSKSKFENCLKNIETIHLGKYQDDSFDFDYKDFSDLCKEGKSKNKTKFIPKTPILLYDSTSKILKKYLTNISNENIPFNELYNNILSLLFYFKIPIIQEKWIENMENQNIIKKDKNKKKDEKDKNKKKDEKKSNKWGKKKNNDISNSFKIEESDSNQSFCNIVVIGMPDLNTMLKKIIAILVDLINIIKEKEKINNI